VIVTPSPVVGEGGCPGPAVEVAGYSPAAERGRDGRGPATVVVAPSPAVGERVCPGPAAEVAGYSPAAERGRDGRGPATAVVAPSPAVGERGCPGPAAIFRENYGLITSYFHPRNLPVLHEMY
jgi:hypothetical protein